MHHEGIHDTSVKGVVAVMLNGLRHDDEQDAGIAEPCYYCGRELDRRYDYSCPLCTRETCDNCSQACQEEDCDTITCQRLRRVAPSWNTPHGPLMNIDSDSQTLAQEGLRQIETAILRLLEASPQGLRNSEIAESLGLRSDFQGRQKDYLTYSILGGLLARGPSYLGPRNQGICSVKFRFYS